MCRVAILAAAAAAAAAAAPATAATAASAEVEAAAAVALPESPCTSDANCSLNGVCDAGSGLCACDAPWRGAR